MCVGGGSRAARIHSTHVTQGGVAETCAKEDRLQVSDSKDGGGKPGKKRGAVAEPSQDLGRPLGRRIMDSEAKLSGR